MAVYTLEKPQGGIGMMLRRNKVLFGNGVDPSCRYCTFMIEEQENGTFICKRDPKHPKTDTGKCKSFHYDPLMRKPQTPAKLPTYRPEDFEL